MSHYDYPHYRLTRDPLSLVLFQIRFSRIRQMPALMPSIQDRLRHEGYPIDASGEINQVSIEMSPLAGAQNKVTSQRRDEFRSKDHHWSVVIGEDQVALLTTAYERYQSFAERLQSVLAIVDETAELHLSQVTRLGMRYIDAIVPRAGESWRPYLQPGLCGLRSDVFVDDEQFIHAQTVGRTQHGTLNLRVWQNNQGIVYPPDIFAGTEPMPHSVELLKEQVITLVDTDHATQGEWDYDLASILETADALHQGINYCWFKHAITEHALEAWGAEPCC